MVFDAFKFYKVNKKYEETKEQLDKEIPIREGLEKKRENLIKVSNTKDKENLIRNMIKRY